METRSIILGVLVAMIVVSIGYLASPVAPHAPTVQPGAIRRDGARFVVAADVRDGDSAITRVEYSIDAQRWQTAFPRDGILDARQESFELRLDAEAAGRTLVIRATDALGNVGTGQIVIR